jgi:hypothetical protein
MTDPHVLGEGLLPTPFTAAEIRRGCPPGRTIRLRVVPTDGPPYERVSRFVDCDAEGATVESWVVGDDGEQVGLATDRSSWLDLQRHAAFPVDGTTVTDESLDLASGASRAGCTREPAGRGSCSRPPCPGCRSATRYQTGRAAWP